MKANATGTGEISYKREYFTRRRAFFISAKNKSKRHCQLIKVTNAVIGRNGSENTFY